MVNIGVADPAVRLRQPQTARVVVVVAPAPVEWSVSDMAVKTAQRRGRVQVDARRVSPHGYAVRAKR